MISIFNYQGAMEIKGIDKIEIGQLEGIYSMCDKKNLPLIESKIDSTKKVFLLGNGNFHYLTLPIFNKLNKKSSLIVFDHHHDGGFLPYEGLISCGSWIKDLVLENKNIEEVYIIGAGVDLNYEEFESEKIKILRDLDYSRENFLSLLDNIKATNIYLSIDRDILSKNELETNWDQGDFSQEELLWAIREIKNRKNIYALDICGDKVWDWQDKNSWDYKNSIEINRKIIKAAGFKGINI